MPKLGAHEDPGHTEGWLSPRRFLAAPNRGYRSPSLAVSGLLRLPSAGLVATVITGAVSRLFDRLVSAELVPGTTPHPCSTNERGFS